MNEYTPLSGILRRRRMPEEGSGESRAVHRGRGHAVLKEAEAGARVSDLCRTYGMSDATYYNWRSKYPGMTVSDLKRLKALEDDNRSLRQPVGERAVDILALKDLLSRDI